MKITEKTLRKEIRKIIKEYTSQAPQVLSQSALSMLGIYVVGLTANSLITIANHSDAVISAQDGIKVFREDDDILLSLEDNKIVFTSETSGKRIEVDVEMLTENDRFDFAVSIYQADNGVDHQTAFNMISRGSFSGEQAQFYHYLLGTDLLDSSHMTIPMTNESIQNKKLKRIIKKIILENRLI
tara:strand:+ start:109 stop:660 length:552 start_codon:yes stop_codon:yes gene_type:complete